MSNEFSPDTLKITKLLTKAEKKENGIYISPKTIIKKLINEILSKCNLTSFDGLNILEPSCGTCEVIKNVIEHINNINTTNIIGIELNKTIYENIKSNNNMTILNQDFLDYELEDDSNRFDIIIGNPPYVVCKKDNVNQKYKQYCNGRPNLFGIFILHSLELLNPNGILAFIIPKSFLNSYYYNDIRKYIIEQYKIVSIIDFADDNLFIDTSQKTCGLIIQNKKSINTTYSSIINNKLYLMSSNIQNVNEIFRNSTTLDKLGFCVKTGNFVWNEHKDILDDAGTLLIYNSNLPKEYNGSLELKQFNSAEKKQYVNFDLITDEDVKQKYKDKYIHNNMLLVVNRGNGNSDYKLNYCLVNQECVIENHLNIIMLKNVDDVYSRYNIIIDSFQNPKTQLFIDNFLFNCGLSKTELETIFPIWI